MISIDNISIVDYKGINLKEKMERRSGKEEGKDENSGTNKIESLFKVFLFLFRYKLSNPTFISPTRF